MRTLGGQPPLARRWTRVVYPVTPMRVPQGTTQALEFPAIECPWCDTIQATFSIAVIAPGGIGSVRVSPDLFGGWGGSESSLSGFDPATKPTMLVQPLQSATAGFVVQAQPGLLVPLARPRVEVYVPGSMVGTAELRVTASIVCARSAIWQGVADNDAAEMAPQPLEDDFTAMPTALLPPAVAYAEEEWSLAGHLGLYAVPSLYPEVAARRQAYEGEQRRAFAFFSTGILPSA